MGVRMETLSLRVIVDKMHTEVQSRPKMNVFWVHKIDFESSIMRLFILARETKKLNIMPGECFDITVCGRRVVSIRRPS